MGLTRIPDRSDDMSLHQALNLYDSDMLGNITIHLRSTAYLGEANDYADHSFLVATFPDGNEIELHGMNYADSGADYNYFSAFSGQQKLGVTQHLNESREHANYATSVEVMSGPASEMLPHVLVMHGIGEKLNERAETYSPMSMLSGANNCNAVAATMMDAIGLNLSDHSSDFGSDNILLEPEEIQTIRDNVSRITFASPDVAQEQVMQWASGDIQTIAPTYQESQSFRMFDREGYFANSDETVMGSLEKFAQNVHKDGRPIAEVVQESLLDGFENLQEPFTQMVEDYIEMQQRADIIDAFYADPIKASSSQAVAAIEAQSAALEAKYEAWKEKYQGSYVLREARDMLIQLDILPVRDAETLIADGHVVDGNFFLSDQTELPESTAEAIAELKAAVSLNDTDAARTDGASVLKSDSRSSGRRLD